MSAVMTDGMRRFGLPELRMGPGVAGSAGGADHAAERGGLPDLVRPARPAQDTSNAAGLLHLPRFLRVPTEMDIHRRDLDRANGVPNRGGTFAIIGLRFDPAQSEDPRGTG